MENFLIIKSNTIAKSLCDIHPIAVKSDNLADSTEGMVFQVTYNEFIHIYLYEQVNSVEY
ncbi:MAG: hypothetical protein IM568_05635 [Flavobacterium sp.]|jgi:hypothetical protein|nr:hypothetical protein [Flavobacterium sp.]